MLVATPLLHKHRRAARTLRGATGLLVLDLNGHRDNMAALARNGATCLDDPAQPHVRRRVASAALGRATRVGRPGILRSYRSHDCIRVLASGDPAFASATYVQVLRDRE